MNVVDLVIIGSIGLLAIVGLRGGIIRPASGIGGIVLGVILGLNYQTQVAAVLAPHLSGDTLARLVGFALIAVLVFALVKGTSLAVIRAVPRFKMGMADHAAGAFAGIVIGLLMLGTAMYLLSGVNVAATREILDSSRLAPMVTKASLVSPSIPWCSSTSSGSSANCHSYAGLIGDMVGIDLKAEMQSLIGDAYEVDTLVSVVKSSLGGGTPEQWVQIANKPK